MVDELFAKVTKGMAYCIQDMESRDTEETECPDDCPYKQQCDSLSLENLADEGAPEILKDAQRLIMEQNQWIEELEKRYSALLDERIAEIQKRIDEEREKLIRAGAITAKDEEGAYGAGTEE